MQLRILGPFEVVQDDIVATPTAPKQRKVLALLAVNANSVVPIDKLIDELWEDRPPDSAITTLQTYVYQLRKVLRLKGPGERPVAAVPAQGVIGLHTSANGYRLAIPDDALDSTRFVSLAERGRAAIRKGDLDNAVVLLRDALRLWRGQVLGDVDTGPVLQAAAVWLEEMRRSVLELRLDIELEMGRHYELVGELTALVAREPTHENLQAKLMLALYRCGRRSEALGAYHKAADALVNELGLEPSAHLRRLHAAVLSADRSLDLPENERIVGAASTVVPNQLPPESVRLIERTELLSSASQALSATSQVRSPILTLVGPPGSGKSAFGTQLAQRLADDYPDGQFHAEMVGPDGDPADLSDVLAGFLREIGVADSKLPESEHERRRMFRDWSRHRKLLLFLDDVTSLDQVRPLLPLGENSAVVIGSRRRLSDPLITATVAVRPLSPAGTMRMIREALGRDALPWNEQDARQLAELCDGLPLAAWKVTALLRLRPHWSIRRLVRHLTPELGRDPAAPSDAFGLAESVQRCRGTMRTEAWQAFERLAVAAQPVSVPSAAEVLAVDEDSAEELLEELVEFQLAEVEPNAHDHEDTMYFRYRFRRPVAAVAAASAPELVPISCSAEAATASVPASGFWIRPRSVS
jgi:DNA-binding SARP family transcriptional activator